MWTRYLLPVVNLTVLLLITVQPSSFLLQAHAGNVYFDNTRSLMRPELGTDMTLEMWDFGGNTVVTGSEISLTQDKQSQQGFLYCTLPVNYPNWEVKFYFRVHGEKSHLFGDGFAFWYTDHRLKRREGGPVFGNRDYFKGLAIFFDTYSNHNGEHRHGHPYVSAMVNDGTKHYDHDTDGTRTELAGCESQFRDNNVDSTKVARIQYKDFTLKVYIETDEDDGEQLCLQVDNLYLPTQYYWGLTAATGDVADNHQITRVLAYHLSFDSNTKVGADQANPSVVPHVKPASESSSSQSSSSSSSDSSARQGGRGSASSREADEGMGWAGWLFLLLCVCGVGGGIAYVYYKKQQERNNKRFF